MTRKCHPEAKPKDLANEKEILRFAQNDSFAVTLGTHRYNLDVALDTHSILTFVFLFKTFDNHL